MLDSTADASSFRDPGGFIFRRGGRLFRQINRAARADGSDAVFANQDGAVAKDAELAESLAASRNGAAQREQLRAASN